MSTLSPTQASMVQEAHLRSLSPQGGQMAPPRGLSLSPFGTPFAPQYTMVAEGSVYPTTSPAHVRAVLDAEMATHAASTQLQHAEYAIWREKANGIAEREKLEQQMNQLEEQKVAELDNTKACLMHELLLSHSPSLPLTASNLHRIFVPPLLLPSSCLPVTHRISPLVGREREPGPAAG